MTVRLPLALDSRMLPASPTGRLRMGLNIRRVRAGDKVELQPLLHGSARTAAKFLLRYHVAVRTIQVRPRLRPPIDRDRHLMRDGLLTVLNLAMDGFEQTWNFGTIHVRIRASCRSRSSKRTGRSIAARMLLMVRASRYQFGIETSAVSFPQSLERELFGRKNQPAISVAVARIGNWPRSEQMPRA